MNRATSIQHLFDEQDHSAIIPDAYQLDLERRFTAASNAVKIMWRDYQYHLGNLKDAIEQKLTYPTQVEKFQLQRHAKNDYEKALKALQQIPYREFAQHGM